MTVARRSGTELGLLLAIVLAILAVFSAKAFTIDDPLFLWLGEHLLSDPLDPFGFTVNWNAARMPMHTMSQNPPLVGYYIAATAAIAGLGERALHLAFLVPAAAAVAATHRLARRLSPRPLEAALAALLTPAFLVSSTSVMCDTTLLALWCGSLLCWVTGFDRRPGRSGAVWWLAAGLLAALAFLTKFFGLALVPLLLAYGLLRERRIGAWSAALLLPVAAVLAYEGATARLYGVGHLTETLRFSASFGISDRGPRLEQLVIGLVFAGGCLIPALFYAPFLWSARACAIAVGLLAAGVLGWPWLGPALQLSPWPEVARSRLLGAQLLTMGLAGASVVALALADLRRRRDADAALLALWLLGTLLFASFVNWVTSARSILPMAPAFGILLARRLGANAPWNPRRGLALACSALVALGVTWADDRWANDVRENARELARRHVSAGHDTYFLGNWGLQYYLDRAGAIAVDELRWPGRGDRLIVSSNNTDVRRPPEELSRLLERVPGSEPRSLRTQSRGVAGFYASAIGPLPYAFVCGEPDHYAVWELLGPVRFSPSW